MYYGMTITFPVFVTVPMPSFIDIPTVLIQICLELCWEFFFTFVVLLFLILLTATGYYFVHKNSTVRKRVAVMIYLDYEYTGCENIL